MYASHGLNELMFFSFAWRLAWCVKWIGTRFINNTGQIPALKQVSFFMHADAAPGLCVWHVMPHKNKNLYSMIMKQNFDTIDLHLTFSVSQSVKSFNEILRSDAIICIANCNSDPAYGTKMSHECMWHPDGPENCYLIYDWLYKIWYPYFGKNVALSS